MKKSIALDWKDCTDLSFMRVVKESGFDGVDVSVGNGLFQKGDPQERIDKICETFEQVGIVCAQTHLGWYPYFSPRDVLTRKSKAICTSV